MSESENKPRTRGSKSASVTANLHAKPDEIRRIITESLQFVPDFNAVAERRGRMTDEECGERLNAYFQLAAQTGQIPTVEDMCLALGVTRQTVHRWEHGELGQRRSDMIKQAKELLAAIDGKLVQENKIPQVTYIFRSKNYYGLKDQQDVIITPNNPLGEQKDVEELRKKYLDSTYNLIEDRTEGDSSADSTAADGMEAEP